MRGLFGSAASTSVSYRADVDGLRAVAVGSVVLFHLSPVLMPGGFVGVDIFFVISGYLISGILFKEYANERFSYREFYGRRIRRIGPALIVVLIACLAFGWFFLLGSEYKSLGRHTAVSALFGSNLLLYKEVDYFAVAAGEKPLVHLWSLGIEEQFYIFWPLLLGAVWRRIPRLAWFLATAIVVSFAACVLTTNVDSSAAFYLPHTRYWELLVGALIAYRAIPNGVLRPPAAATLRMQPPSLPGRESLAWLGLTLIAFSLYWLDSASIVFPGWWAATPVAGTAFLIAAGPQTTVNRAVLGNRLMAGIGTLAYPIYLWHWPLFVFVLLGGGGRLARVLAVLATLLLAWLTKVLVEDPLRFGRASEGRRRHLTAVALFGVLLLVGSAGLVTDRSNGFLSRYSPELRVLAGDVSAEEETAASPDVDPGCFLRQRQTVDMFPAACAGEASAPAGRTLLWGDSFAFHLGDGFRRLAAERHFALAEYTSSACPPIVGLQLTQRPGCTAINDFVVTRVKQLHPERVVLTANWMLYDESVARQLIRTIQMLQQTGIRRVIVVGPLSSWPASLPQMLARSAMLNGTKTIPGRLPNDQAAPTLERDNLVRTIAVQGGAEYVSAMNILCDDGRTCLTLVPGLAMTPMQFDIGHLSSEGSNYVVRQIADRLAIP